MSARVPVAIVDDDDDLRASLAQMLSIEGFSPRAFASAKVALRELEPDFPGPVVTDVRMPGLSGIDLLQRLVDRDSDLPVILMTGHADVDMAVAALKAGAWDFLTKPFEPDAMVAAVGRAAGHRALVLENRALKQAGAVQAAQSPLIGRTPAIERLRDTVDILARTDLDILIEGETGTGKELIARLIHAGGDGRRGRFVAIACPALPDGLIEGELFGAHGAIASAAGGTLFLDDVDRASAALQARLAAFAEARLVGSGGSAAPVDCRIIGGATRAEGIVPVLLYRLAGMRLTVPPLRERAADVPLLFSHFVAEAARRLRRAVPPIDAATRDALVVGDWPGNVRQLASFADQFVLGLLPSSPASEKTLPERVDAFERSAIVDAVLSAGGEVARAIAALGLPRKTFYYKVARHGIDLADLRRRAR